MNSDLTPGPPGARDTGSGPPGIRPHWRAANNLHAALFADDTEPPPARGEIWSIRHPASADAELALAVIAAISGETMTVVPLSTDVDHATEWDLVLPIATLGYPAIVQAKLAGTVAPDRLKRRLSTLMPDSRRDLGQLLAAAEAGQAIPPEHLPVGPWVLSEHDPRLAARIRTAEHLAGYLSLLDEDPISEWRSLGSILTRGSRATGIDLATVVGEPRWTTRLQSDQLDPFAMLPPRKMAEMLRTLRIGWTDRVRYAVYRLASQFAPSEIPQGSVFGRRQGTRGRRRTPASVSEHASVDAAGDYVRAVERELGKL